MYEYFLQIDNEYNIIGSHKVRSAGAAVRDELIKESLSTLEPKGEVRVVHVDPEQFFKYNEAFDYLPDETLTAMQRRVRPSAYWDQDKKTVCFIPILKLDKVEGCDFIDSGKFISSVIGDAPGVYRVTGAYPTIRFSLEAVCHLGESDEMNKEKFSLDPDDFTVSVLAGNSMLLPNNDIKVHISNQRASKRVAFTVPNPKTNLMLVELNHKSALFSSYSFYFVWNED